MPLTVVFLHGEREYAQSLGTQLMAANAAGSRSLEFRYATNVNEAVARVTHANRLLFDADDDFLDVLEHAQDGVRSYALTTKLDAALSAYLFRRGAIAIGACRTDRDLEALAEVLVSGVAAGPRPMHVLEYLATPGRYALVRSEEDDAMLETVFHLTHHNVTKTAALLGYPRSTVQSQLWKLGLLKRSDDS